MTDALGAIDTGDTAWMIVASAMVLLMTPALGLFYAGFVRSKNVLNTFMMSIAAFGVATVVWALVGYSLAFDTGSGFIGGLGHVFMHDIGFGPRDGQTIPHLLFFVFQTTFIVVTAALVSGAVVERMRFGAYLVFMALWCVAVYAVLAHWVWGPDGWLFTNGVLDFAGGVPVEMASGFSAFAAALVVGARKDYGRLADVPHNALFILLGAGLLWFGWIGFNGGSGFSVGNQGILAVVNTLLTPAFTLIMWFIFDLLRGRKVTAVGAATAIVVGCVGITPAAGLISPTWAMALGIVVAVPSYAMIMWRPRTRLDETLDVLGAHGLAGLTGTLAIGVVAQKSWNGVGDGALYGNVDQLLWQLIAVLAATTYAFGMTYVLLRLVGWVMPLRVSRKDEAIGLDITEHGEEAYASGEGAILLVQDLDGTIEGEKVRV
jgi:Amt family ammonium transporter